MHAVGLPIGHGNWGVAYLWDVGMCECSEFDEYVTVEDFKEADPKLFTQFHDACVVITADQNVASWLYHATGSSL